jgi:hypothetical protein
MGAAAAGIVAIRERRYRDIESAFRLGDATAPDRARTIDELGVVDLPEAEDLVSMGVLKAGLRPGTYYLDERTLLQRTNSRRMRMLFLLIVLVLALAAGILLTRVGRS